MRENPSQEGGNDGYHPTSKHLAKKMRPY